jgi:glycosyltransferase involved in cell wall biosynthesis
MSAPVVLHVCAAEYSARTLLLPQMRYLEDRGFDVRVACCPDGEAFGDDLAPFRPMAVPFSRSMELRPLASSMRRLRSVIDEIRPAVVHLHSSSAAAPARMLPRWALASRPSIVFTVHGFPFSWSDLGGAKARGLERLERILARRTDVLLFQSGEDYGECERRGYRSRLRYLGNGVQDEWFELAPPAPHGDRLRVLFVGRLIRAKGILDLLEAAAEVPEIELRVVGGRLASERDDIRSELDRMGNDLRLAGRLHFVGSVHPDQMRANMGWADAFALPTFHDEGVPRSIIEAMAAARPAIVTNVKGCRELVDDGIEGLVVEARDVAGLVRALRRLVESPAERSTMGEAGRARAWRNHREADVLSRLESAYAELGVRPGRG